MTTHIAGAKAETLRKALQAPPDAVFANEIVTANRHGSARCTMGFSRR